MPIYEYTCPDCHHECQLFRAVAERDNPVSCEECRTDMRRQVSKSSFALKGSGWASDNYGLKK